MYSIHVINPLNPKPQTLNPKPCVFHSSRFVLSGGFLSPENDSAVLARHLAAWQTGFSKGPFKEYYGGLECRVQGSIRF